MGSSAQCPGRKDFPESVNVMGRAVSCTPTSASEPCSAGDKYYQCSSMLVADEEGDSQLRVDNIKFANDVTDPAALCQAMMSAAGATENSSGAQFDSGKTQSTVYYNSDGAFGDRDSTYIQHLKCQFA